MPLGDAEVLEARIKLKFMNYQAQPKSKEWMKLSVRARRELLAFIENTIDKRVALT